MPRIALAPMMDKTTPHFRYLIRQLFPELWLYTEMISSAAIIHGDFSRFLALHPCEAPIALQLGSHCPEETYRAVITARQFCAEQNRFFAEYNLNAGCPSDRVQNRNIGAILMNDAPLVADILSAIRQALKDTQNLYLDQPPQFPQVTLKHRLGIEQKSKGISISGCKQLCRFLEQVAPYCNRLIIHARIAILDGLDPKQNREIPPLNYPLVFELRKIFNPLPVELNGGLRTYQQIAAVWPKVDGVMLGRVSYENTWELFRIRKNLLAKKQLLECAQQFQQQKFQQKKSKQKVLTAPQSRAELVAIYAKYLEENPSAQSISAQIWPLLTLWYNLPEARRWRRMLSPPYSVGQTAAKLARQAQELMSQLEQKYKELCLIDLTEQKESL